MMVSTARPYTPMNPDATDHASSSTNSTGSMGDDSSSPIAAKVYSAAAPQPHVMVSFARLRTSPVTSALTATCLMLDKMRKKAARAEAQKLRPWSAIRM
jgi:hypothetical protein